MHLMVKGAYHLIEIERIGVKTKNERPKVNELSSSSGGSGSEIDGIDRLMLMALG